MDKKQNIFNRPFPCENDIIAQRQFTTAANDSSTEVHHYPDEFDLYRVGSFDDTNGQFTNDQIFIVNAKTVQIQG